MNQQALKIGIIGVANFGAYRRSTLRQSGRFHMVAVCDRNERYLAAAATEENAKPYSDFDAMLKHPGLEAVVVSTGADTHARFSVAAMRAGLHVFVEKPFCTNLAEVHQLRRAQRETGRVVGVGHSHCPSQPYLKLACDFIREGKLGVVTAYEENSSHSGGLEIKPGDWRGLSDRNPGGMLFQCGVHALHSLAWLFGPFEAVQAMMRYDANPNTQTADAANVLLRHPTGLIGTLNCYHTTAYCHELRIFGTKGNLYFDTNDMKGWFQPRKRGEVEQREPLTIPAAPPGFAHANVDSWYDAIRNGAACYPSLEDGIQAVLPVFAAEIAAKQRREVSLKELGSA